MAINVLMIGALNFPHIPQAGDAIKNRYLLDFFNENFASVKYVDTQKWRTNPLVLLSVAYYLIFRNINNIIISTSNESAYRIICILSKLHFKHTNIYYFMIGGYTPIKIKQGIFKAEPFHCIKKIIVEADKVRDFYREVGLTNTYRVYNFKPTQYQPDVTIPHTGKVRFVFLSRITELKGVFHILESAKKLNANGLENAYELDFYGRIDNDIKEKFTKEVEGIDNVHYRGFLNLNQEDNYNILSEYDAMLFPTMHPTEGFPGVIADAAIAGVPVIASNWNYAKELVEDCGCGIVFPVGDKDALTKQMEIVIHDRTVMHQMRQQCIKRSDLYRVSNVLTPNLLFEIGMK